MAFEILDQANIPSFHNPGEPMVHLPRELKKKKKKTEELVLLCLNQNPVNGMMGN